MKPRARIFHVLFALMMATPAIAADPGPLYDQLRGASEQDAPRIEAEIDREWQRSGSASMDLLLQRGQEALAMGEVEAAIDHLSALIDHAPDFAEGYNARAAAFFQQGDYGQAIDDIAHVLTLDPRHFTAISGLALILEDMDRPNEAIAAWREALAIHPHLEGAAEAIERLETETEGREI